jgi:eukaryotic-like serine/threonine-protein kinase
MREMNVVLCPTDDDLKQFLEGLLPPGEFEHLEAHIEGCAHCQAKLKDLTQFAGDGWLSVAGMSLPMEETTPDPMRMTIPGYVLQEILGSGSQSVVYKALDQAMNRKVALKLFLAEPTLALKSELVRFQRESELVGKLNHPNVVTVFQVGVYAGRPFLVMEWIPAGTLAQVILDGIPDDRASAEYLIGIARGVQSAHENGIIHRDLKPTNVLMAAGSGSTAFVPKIADFGLAKSITPDGGQTTKGSAFGTPTHMAPEIAVHGAKEANAATDIYSIGVIGYQLLTGRPPFQGQTPYETVKLACEELAVPPRDLRRSVPSDLETIVLKCLEKSPKARYASAQELAQDLERYLNGQAIHARPESFSRSWLRRARLHPAITTLLSVLAVVVIGSTVGLAELWLEAVQAMKEAVGASEKAVEATKQAQDSAAKAERRLALATEALDTFKKSADVRSRSVDRQAPEDRDVLIKLEALYTQTWDDFPNDHERRHDIAYAILQIADMHDRLFDYHPAVEVSEKAHEMLRGLVQEHPEADKYQSSFSEACCQLANHRAHAGQQEGYLVLMREAYDLADDLVKRFPGKDHYLGTRASFGFNIGLTLSRANKADQGLVFLQKSVEDRRLLVEKYFEDPFRQNDYLGALLSIAEVLALRHTPSDDTIKAMKVALNHWERYRSQLPKQARQNLPNAEFIYRDIAIIYANTGRPAESAIEMQIGLSRMESLLTDFPSSITHRNVVSEMRKADGFRLLPIDRMAGLARLQDAQNLENLRGIVGNNNAQQTMLDRADTRRWLLTAPELQRPDLALPILERLTATDKPLAIDQALHAVALTELDRIPEALTIWERIPTTAWNQPLAEPYFRLHRAITWQAAGGQAEASAEVKRITSELQADYRTDWFTWQVLSRFERTRKSGK